MLGLAVIFQDWIRGLFKRPKLGVSIKVEPPDCHKTSFYQSEVDRKVCDTYYFRFRVENTGNYFTENVEAMITEVHKKEGKIYKKINSFLPLNLVWSHYRSITIPQIQPHLFKHLDLGHILKTNPEFLARFGLTSTNKVFFELDVLVRPNTGSHIFFPGKYKLQITFAGNNFDSQKKIYFLNLEDEWDDNEKTMLEKNITITEGETFE